MTDSLIDDLNYRLRAYELAFGTLTLAEIEWSGYREGPGYGPHGSGDGPEYAACPVCGQLKEPNGDFIREAVGHLHSCKLARHLKSPRNPPSEDELQEEMF